MDPACTYVYSLADKNVRNKWLLNKLAMQEEMTNAWQIWTFLMTCYWATISEDSKMNALENNVSCIPLN